MAGVQVLLVSSRNGKGLVLPKVKLPLPASRRCLLRACLGKPCLMTVSMTRPWLLFQHSNLAGAGGVGDG